MPGRTTRPARQALTLICVAAALTVTCRTSVAEQSVIARGAYLARITGCVGCHTPRTSSGDIVEDRLMSGGDHPIPGGAGHLRIYPPNITPDSETGLGGWQVADIVKAVKDGTTPGGGRLSSAMPWRSQFRTMDDADATAIATYLKSLPPIRHAVPPPVGGEPR